MRLSIVTTLFRSAPFIEEFHRRVSAVAKAFTSDFEIIMVNDGSPDQSLDLAVGLHHKDPRVIVVDLSRNFGHHRAIMAGLSYARGELVFLIDSDLDDAPEELPRFYARMQQENCDVVYGVQSKRRGGIFDALSGNLFYWLLGKMGGLNIPRHLCTVRLMTKRYVAALLQHQERELIISGLWVLTGFDQVAEPVRKSRSGRRSSYTMMRRVKLAIDHLTTFSDAVLYVVFVFGLGISLISFAATLYFVVNYFLTRDPVAGWTSIMASIWLFGGASLFVLGLIGIYVARIFIETKNRPYVIVRDLYRTDVGADGMAAGQISQLHR